MRCTSKLVSVAELLLAAQSACAVCFALTCLHIIMTWLLVLTVLNPRPFLVLFVSALPGVVQKEGENLEYLGGQDCLPLFL